MNCLCINEVHSYFRFNHQESASGLRNKQRLIMLPLIVSSQKLTIGISGITWKGRGVHLHAAQLAKQSCSTVSNQ